MSNDKYRVSVIIPAYNVERSLSITIDSVLRQTLNSCEVIVVNDGSSDKTGDVARSYGDKIVYIKQHNQGQGAARNTGLQQAHGEFVAFLDADDYWLEGFIEKCVNFLDEHKDAVAVTTGHITKFVNRKDLITPQCLHNQEIKAPVVTENFFSFWAEQDHIRTGSNIIRKSVIDEAGTMRADLRGVGEDFEYWGYIATFGKWGFIPEPLWVGNSQAVAATKGWFKKYKYRCKNLASIDTWEERMLPRLKDIDIPGFKAIRGFVAAGSTQNKIIAGNFSGALEIVKKYGDSMPRNRLTLLMRTGARSGKYGWSLACFIIRMKELVKSWRLRLRARTANV